MDEPRSRVVSSFTIIKGALIEETYAAFGSWNLEVSKKENLRRLKETNAIGAKSSNWLRDVAWVLNRRFDTEGSDRPLVELAKGSCEREVWHPLLLWHMTRDEFLLRDFLVNWLYRQYIDGVYRVRAVDVAPYLRSLSKKKDLSWSGKWSESTSARVASGLLRIAADFEFLEGKKSRKILSYHLPEESFLYLLYALAESEPNARRIIESEEWHMFMMDSDEVEREVLRLHQYGKLQYEAAGTLAQLTLPCSSASEYAREIVA